MSWYKISSYEKLFEEMIKKVKSLVVVKDLFAISESLIKTKSNKIPKIKIGTIGDFSIFIIDGNLVKTRLEMDFVEGANDQAYSSETNPDNKDVIPKNEVWISSELRIEYIPYVILHEIIEAQIMKNDGLDYSSAHEIANKYEKIARKKKLLD